MQDRMFHAGVLTARVFCGMARDADSLRDLLRTEFEQDETASFATRIEVSKVVNAWESCRVKGHKLLEVQADQEMRLVP